MPVGSRGVFIYVFVTFAYFFFSFCAAGVAPGIAHREACVCRFFIETPPGIQAEHIPKGKLVRTGIVCQAARTALLQDKRYPTNTPCTVPPRVVCTWTDIFFCQYVLLFGVSAQCFEGVRCARAARLRTLLLAEKGSPTVSACACLSLCGSSPLPSPPLLLPPLPSPSLPSLPYLLVIQWVFPTPLPSPILLNCHLLGSSMSAASM